MSGETTFSASFCFSWYSSFSPDWLLSSHASVEAIVVSILDLSASDSLPLSFSSLIVFLTLKQ